MHALLIHASLALVVAVLTVSLFLIWRAGPALRSLLQGSRTEAAVLAALILGSWSIRQFAVLHTHNVYYDEFQHLQLAQTLLATGQFGRTDIAGDPTAPVIRSVKWPPAFHVSLAAALGLGGSRESTAFALNSIWGALGIGSAWFLVRLSGFGSLPALLAAALTALWPLHLRLSGGVSLEVSAVAMTSFALGFLFGWARSGAKELWWAAVATTALAGLFRVESVLAVVVIGGVRYGWAARWGVPLPALRFRELRWAAVGLLPCLLYALSGSSSYRAFHAQASDWPVLQALPFWFQGEWMPYAYALAALAGLAILFRRDVALLAGLLAWLAFPPFFFGLLLRVPISEGDHQRFWLLAQPVLVLAWAALFRECFRLAHGGFAPILACLAIVGFSLPTLLRLRTVPFDAEREQLYRFVLAQERLPREARYFAAFPPFVATTLGVRCEPLPRLLNTEPSSEIPDPRPMIYVTDLIVLGIDTFRELDEEIRLRYRCEPIAETTIPSGTIGCYRVTPAHAPSLEAMDAGPDAPANP